MNKTIKRTKYLKPDRPRLAKELGISQQYLCMILAGKRKALKIKIRMNQLLDGEHKAA